MCEVVCRGRELGWCFFYVMISGFYYMRNGWDFGVVWFVGVGWLCLSFD